jgi:hypothetical protein
MASQLLNGVAGVSIVKRTVVWTLMTLSLITASTFSSSGREVVEIRLRGHYFAEPATVQITVAVEPSDENRALFVEADGEHYFRSSALALDGKNEKRLHTVEFKNLPAGSYVLRAQVRSYEDVLATATQDLVVTGIGGR